MQLPYVIQYLLTLRSPNGDPLVYGGISQEVVPFFPPGQSIRLETNPGKDYAHLGFFGGVGPAVVPGAFYSVAWQAGGRIHEGIVTGYFAGNDLFHYLVETHARPAVAILTNTSPLVQYYEGYVGFLRVASAEDYELVKDALDRLGTSSKLESGAIQAANLLETMKESEVPYHPPPLPPTIIPGVGGRR